MTLAATVLYEDSKIGPDFPLHQLVMRLVEDDRNGHTHVLLAVVKANSRNGIDKLLGDIGSTSLIAGRGHVFVLVDRDVIRRKLGLADDASDEAVVAEFKRRSDAPDKLSPFFLEPNLEGLLRSIKSCDPALLPDAMTSALTKSLIDRDRVLKEAKRPSNLALRNCIRAAQPGLDALAKAIAALIPTEAIT